MMADTEFGDREEMFVGTGEDGKNSAFGSVRESEATRAGGKSIEPANLSPLEAVYDSRFWCFARSRRSSDIYQSLLGENPSGIIPR